MPPTMPATKMTTAPEHPHVVSSTHEGLHVYVLLSDNRVLKSRALGNTHCAEIHADQVIKLRLQPVFLQEVMRYTEEAI